MDPSPTNAWWHTQKKERTNFAAGNTPDCCRHKSCYLPQRAHLPQASSPHRRNSPSPPFGHTKKKSHLGLNPSFFLNPRSSPPPPPPPPPLLLTTRLVTISTLTVKSHLQQKEKNDDNDQNCAPFSWSRKSLPSSVTPKTHTKKLRQRPPAIDHSTSTHAIVNTFQSHQSLEPWRHNPRGQGSSTKSQQREAVKTDHSTQNHHITKQKPWCRPPPVALPPLPPLPRISKGAAEAGKPWYVSGWAEDDDDDDVIRLRSREALSPTTESSRHRKEEEQEEQQQQQLGKPPATTPTKDEIRGCGLGTPLWMEIVASSSTLHAHRACLPFPLYFLHLLPCTFVF